MRGTLAAGLAAFLDRAQSAAHGGKRTRRLFPQVAHAKQPIEACSVRLPPAVPDRLGKYEGRFSGIMRLREKLGERDIGWQLAARAAQERSAKPVKMRKHRRSRDGTHGVDSNDRPLPIHTCKAPCPAGNETRRRLLSRILR